MEHSSAEDGTKNISNIYREKRYFAQDASWWGVTKLIFMAVHLGGKRKRYRRILSIFHGQKKGIHEERGLRWYKWKKEYCLPYNEWIGWGGDGNDEPDERWGWNAFTQENTYPPAISLFSTRKTISKWRVCVAVLTPCPKMPRSLMFSRK